MEIIRDFISYNTPAFNNGVNASLMVTAGHVGFNSMIFGVSN